MYCITTHNSRNNNEMKISLILIYGQVYLSPYVKITYDRFLNGDYELIIGWLKWELIIAI
jgi:hypothetical protein